MNGKVTFKGSPMTLVGKPAKEGMPAPDFRVVGNQMNEVSLKDFKGKVKVITFFVSIDTPVCDLQVKEFNKRAASLSSDVTILGISKDLPFAQARFCQANEIKNLSTLSDYKYNSFGENYGVLVKELNLLARGVLIVDKKDVIRYLRIVDELTAPPDYDDALRALESVLKGV